MAGSKSQMKSKWKLITLVVLKKPNRSNILEQIQRKMVVFFILSVLK